MQRHGSACSARRTPASTRCRSPARTPPALGAVFAIYASDDRWTDDVHWRGGALKLVDLVDYCHYMTPMCVLPPVPAVWGDGWREEWRRRLETNQPWVLRWLRENRHGAYWRGGSVRLGADGGGYERIDVPDDARRRLGRRLPQQLLPHGRRAAAKRRAAPVAGRAVGARRPDAPRCRGRGSTSTSRWRRGSTGGCASTGDREAAYDSRCDVFVRSSTRPEPDLDLHEGCWMRLPSVPPTAPVDVAARGPRAAARPCPTPAPPPGSTAPGTSRGASPATSASTTPAR